MQYSPHSCSACQFISHVYLYSQFQMTLQIPAHQNLYVPATADFYQNWPAKMKINYSMCFFLQDNRAFLGIILLLEVFTNLLRALGLRQV